MQQTSTKFKWTMAISLITCLTGCKMGDDLPKFSTDIAALEKIIELPVPHTEAKWEVFGTPEYSGGVPGPTDYMTLVAEIKMESVQKMNYGPSSEPFWIAPESARTWLSPKFSRLLESSKNAYIDTADHPDCAPIEVTMKKSRTRRSGFICEGSESFLVYLMIANFTSG